MSKNQYVRYACVESYNPKTKKFSGKYDKRVMYNVETGRLLTTLPVNSTIIVDISTPIFAKIRTK